MSQKHIMLDEDDFTCLVRGGVIEFGDLRIALRDIGFDQMDQCIDLAKDGINIYKNHIKEA